MIVIAGIVLVLLGLGLSFLQIRHQHREAAAGPTAKNPEA